MLPRSMLSLAILALCAPAFELSIQAQVDPPAKPPLAEVPGIRVRKDDDAGPPVLGYEDVPQEDGRGGDLPPLARRLELAVASVDLDTIGRARAQLAGFTARRGGFNLLLKDDRDGRRGYVVQSLEHDLSPHATAQRLDEQASGRGQNDALLTTSGSGVHCAIWLDVADQSGLLRGRAWDDDGKSITSWSMPLPVDRRDPAAIEPASMVGLQPTFLWGEPRWTLAWQIAGRVLMRDVDPRTGESSQGVMLGSRAQTAIAGPRLARDPSGVIACAFDTPEAIVLDLRTGPDSRITCNTGPGKLLGLAADTRSEAGGWWMLVHGRSRVLLLRHFDRNGVTDRHAVRLAEEWEGTASLSVDALGPCVLVQHAKGGLEAVWVGEESPSPALTRTELCAADRDVIASHAAFEGSRWGFAWSERRGSDACVFARTCSRNGESLGAERELIQGDGRAIQAQPTAAQSGGRGLIAWSDRRFGESVIVARGWQAQRRLGSGELCIPAPAGSASADEAQLLARERSGGKLPAVAMHSSGRGLIVWLAAGAAGPSLLAQSIEVDDEANLHTRGEPIELDPGAPGIASATAASVVALRSERGFLVAWAREASGPAAKRRASKDDGRSELRLARVSLTGELDLGPRTIAEGPLLARPALSQLDDGRIVAAWDVQPQENARRLVARVFSERLEPELRELYFETMWRGTDHSAAVAPAPGGFALAWTSGEDDQCDVFARVYDAKGAPLSRPIALSPRAGAQSAVSLARAADAGFVAVWQDDLSQHSRLVGRRFSIKGAQPGRLARFGFGAEPAFADFSMPRVLALDGGRVLVAGEHVVPDRSGEIGLCIVGPGWDEVEGR